MELTRRGLFGLVGAAALGSALPQGQKAQPVVQDDEPKVITITMPRLTDSELNAMTREIIKRMSRQLDFMGGLR